MGRTGKSVYIDFQPGSWEVCKQKARNLSGPLKMDGEIPRSFASRQFMAVITWSLYGICDKRGINKACK